MRLFKAFFSILLLFLVPCTAASSEDRLLLNLSDGKATIQLSLTEDKTALRFSIGGEAKVLTSFAVRSPYRVVIDLANAKFKKQSVVLPENPLAKSVRIGQHPDKVRIVVDLSKNSTPNLISTQTGNVLKLDILYQELKTPTSVVIQQPTNTPPSASPLPDSAASTVTATPSLTASATTIVTPETIATPSPTAIVQSDLTVAPTQTAVQGEQDLTSTPVATTVTEAANFPTPVVDGESSPAVANEAKSNSVLAVGFERNVKEALKQVKISLAAAPDFRLVKLNDRTFELSLDNTTLNADSLTLPHYPPEDFTGITFVQALRMSLGTRIRIGVDRNVRIVSIVKGNDILISVK